MANLTQVARIVKSEIVLITVVILSVGIFGLAIFSFLNRDKAPSTPPGTPWQNTIYPGNTTREQLESALGSPQEIKEENGQIEYLYPSKSEFRPHKVGVSDNIVQIIKEQVSQGEDSLNNYTQKYGTPQQKVWGQHGTFAPGYFWSSAGLLVFANEFDGTIIEIWYFPPALTSEELVAKNPELSLEEPKHF